MGARRRRAALDRRSRARSRRSGRRPGGGATDGAPAEQRRRLGAADRPLVVGLAAAPGVGVGRVRVLRVARAGRRAGRRGDARRPDDQPRLGAGDPAGGRPGDRQRRHDLPRRHRHPRARHPGCRRRPARHHACCATASSSPSTAPRGRGARVTSRAPTEAAADRRRHASAADRGAARRRGPATQLYVNLAFADRAEEVAAMPVDGVGLLRAEFLLTDALGGRHPKALLARGGAEEFVDRLSRLAAADHPPVRTPAGRLPHDRLPHERVPQARGRRRVRARTRTTR